MFSQTEQSDTRSNDRARYGLRSSMKQAVNSLKYASDLSRVVMRGLIPRPNDQGAVEDHNATPAVVDEAAITPEWTGAATLRDGSEVQFRLLRSDDRDELHARFNDLSEQTRYLRFMTPMEKLPDSWLDHLVNVDNENHLAIVAFREAPGTGEMRGAGVARFFRDSEDPTHAEMAITVLDDLQGTGLGTLLFLILGRAAVERGIDTFDAAVLAENDGMKALAKRFDGVARSTQEGTQSWEIPLSPAHDN